MIALSATIIEDVFCHTESNSSVACAYFFYDGRDGQKGSQSLESLIRSLIRQFSTPYGGIPAVLTKLYHSCHHGGCPPSVESLQATLLLILEAFNDVYIIIDSIDECTERKKLLKWIKEMTTWKDDKLHLLATSRPEEDIAQHLRPLDHNHVCMKPEFVTPDIEKYIDGVLQAEESFERWGGEVKACVKSKLLESAGGMYSCFPC